MAWNINNYFLSTFYNDYLWQMGAVYSNTNLKNVYASDNLIRIVEGDYLVFIDWVPKESNARYEEDALKDVDDNLKGDKLNKAI